ncbi:hypothetical protein F8M41_007525 [Gigaspora margarita]|uniref:Uncharacterized protein n=1 Tax=Gigaspora margarita TaxID=4874 RepID=A0A8H4ER59_GIGMA|nr:hypothetical protein F8M41_007525 [Gigaspora margarita]
MNNNIIALQKQIDQAKEELKTNHKKNVTTIGCLRQQFKEELQKEKTRLQTNHQNRFNEYFQFYYEYFQNLTLQSTPEIRQLKAKIERKNKYLRVLTQFLNINIRDCIYLEERIKGLENQIKILEQSNS